MVADPPAGDGGRQVGVVDDPAVLGEIAEALRGLGYPRKA